MTLMTNINTAIFLVFGYIIPCDILATCPGFTLVSANDSRDWLQHPYDPQQEE